MKRSRGMSGSVRHRDQRVRVGGVPDHEDPHVVRGSGAQRLALRLEDLAVRLEQVGPLHALRARAGAHQQRDVHTVERLDRVVVDLGRGQQRERAVLQLERGALGGLDRVRDLEQAQLDLLVRAEHLARRDPKQQGVTDLAGCARHGDRFIEHLLYDGVSELTRTHGGRVVTRGLEVVGHLVALADHLGDAALHAVGGLGLVQVAQHQHAGEHKRGRVDLVLALVLGGRAVRGLEDRAGCADVRAGREPEAADHAGAEVGDDVAVEVGQHDHVVLLGPRHELVAEVVDDAVLELDVGMALGHLRARPRGTARPRTS